jgi:hypothetical protein
MVSGTVLLRKWIKPLVYQGFYGPNVYVTVRWDRFTNKHLLMRSEFKEVGRVLKYHYTDTEVKKLLSTAIVLIDSREQVNAHITDYFAKQNLLSWW